jgi:hypothetical protein
VGGCQTQPPPAAGIAAAAAAAAGPITVTPHWHSERSQGSESVMAQSESLTDPEAAAAAPWAGPAPESPVRVSPASQPTLQVPSQLARRLTIVDTPNKLKMNKY